VKVGDVRRVYIDVSNPEVAIADTEVDRLTPITRSTKADVGIAGLTGQANIELRGGDPSEQNLLDIAEDEGTIATITASPSAVTNLLQTAQDIFGRAEAVLSELEGFAAEARGPLTRTVTNVEQFSAALGRNAEGIDDFLENVSAMSQTLSGVSGRLESTLASAEKLIDSVDPDRIAATIENVESFTRRVDEASASLEQIMTSVDQTVIAIAEFSASAKQSLAKVDGVIENVDSVLTSVGDVVEGVDPATVRTALTNFEQASVSVNAAANEVAELAETIGSRTGDVDKIITDAQQFASRLNQASTRVDDILVKVDELLGSGEAEGVMADASETLRSFQQVAETLNQRLGPILDGLGQFSGQGLQDVEALVRDSRRSINRIERAISDFESNPQRLLSGGDGAVREFDGRARR
jgi:phospholipid/cholesterol/gamma-HCH transport system substrate-binding protein